MKVLFISDNYSIGGTSRVMSRLAEIFTENGIKVDILIPNYIYQKAPNLTMKANLYYIAKDDNLKNKFFLAIDLVKFWIKLIKFSRTHQYNYIISFWNYINILLIITPLFSSTKKVICSHISFPSLKLHWKILTRFTYPFADNIVVLNEREKNVFQNFCQKVTVIENPLPKL